MMCSHGDVAQIKFLSDKRAILAEDCASAAAKAECLDRQLSEAATESDGLRAALAEAQKQAQRLTVSTAALTAQNVCSGFRTGDTNMLPSL